MEMRFIYFILSVIFTIIAIISHPLVASGLSPENIDAQIARNITVLIDGSGQGSGIIINRVGDRYTVLTCAHVIRELKGHGIILIGEVQYPFDNKNTKMIPGVDLAEIYFDDSSHLQLARMNSYGNGGSDIGNIQLIKRGSSKPREGDTIYIAGHDSSSSKDSLNSRSNYSFISGRVISATNREKDGYQLKYTNKTARGMSGGPIFNQNGELIGIHGKVGGGIPISQYPSDSSNNLPKEDISPAYQYVAKLENHGCSNAYGKSYGDRQDGKNLIAIDTQKQIIISSCSNDLDISRLSDGKLLKTLSGHVGGIQSVHANENNIVTTANDKTIRIWSLPKAKLLHTIYPSSSGADLVAMSSGKNSIITSIYGNTLKIWKVSDGKLLRTQALSEYTGVSTSAAVSPDGKTIAVGFEDKTVKVWSVSDGKLVHTLDSHLSQVSAVAISPDGKTIVSGSYDRTVKIWRLSDGELLKTLTAGSGFTFDYINSVAISADNSTVIAASYNFSENFYIWRISDNQVIGRFKVGASPASKTAISYDANTVICDGEIFRRASKK
jgi:WD40 repeat protein